MAEDPGHFAWTEVREVAVDLLRDNPLSANEEDTATFEALKRELAEHGLLEFPVAVPQADGTYRVIAGHHRGRAWKALGHQTIRVTVITQPLTREEEFNLVNNMNLVRGTIRKPRILEIVRREGLDPTKLNIFKFPSTKFMATVDEKAIASASAEAARRAQLANLSMRIAQEIAAAILDERDELVTILTVRDKLAAVIRIPFKSGKLARESAPALKEMIEKQLEGLMSRVDLTSNPVPKDRESGDAP